MQISSIVDIVGGKLLNTPAISFITQIQTNPSKINDGDLFIANCQEDIELAISNGAFGILFSDEIEISDKEIAWIKIDDTKKTLVKLLRFILSTKEIKSFYCDDISFEFLNIFSSSNKDIVLLTNNIQKDFELLKNIDNNKTLFCTNNKYINAIQPSSSEFTVDEYQISNLTIHSLFTTTFSYKNDLFYKLKLPSIYVNNFLSILEFLKQPVETNKLKDFKYFSPIFINKNFEIIDFGKSNKFILASDNMNIIKAEIKFLQSYYDYAKIRIIKEYKNDEDLFNQMKQYNFNALYIVGKSQEEIKTLLCRFKKNSITLI